MKYNFYSGQPLCYTPVTYKILYINYSLVKKKKTQTLRIVSV